MNTIIDVIKALSEALENHDCDKAFWVQSQVENWLMDPQEKQALMDHCEKVAEICSDIEEAMDEIQS